jgi:hypothetical protein
MNLVAVARAFRGFLPEVAGIDPLLAVPCRVERRGRKEKRYAKVLAEANSSLKTTVNGLSRRERMSGGR